MQEIIQSERDKKRNGEVLLDGVEEFDAMDSRMPGHDELGPGTLAHPISSAADQMVSLRRELFEIRDLLSLAY
jgi:hypothetical protein